MSEYLIKAILLLLHRQHSNGESNVANKTEASDAHQLKELIESDTMGKLGLVNGVIRWFVSGLYLFIPFYV